MFSLFLMWNLCLNYFLRPLTRATTRIIFGLILLCLSLPLSAELPPVPVPPENPITEEKRVLGKILFWDEQLSSDDTMACGSCHISSAGGSDPRQGINPGPDGLFNTNDDIIASPGIVKRDENGLPIEDTVFGFTQQVTGRSAPGIFISMFSEQNVWDGRADSRFVDPQDGQTVVIQSGGSLENQAVAPILSEVEMAHRNRNWSQVISKLEDAPPLRFASKLPADMSAAIVLNPSYPALFASAFGDVQITAARIAMAIATYERTLVPDQSPWDLYQAGDDTAMTASQIAGWEDFRDNTVCDNCHRPPEFTDHQFHNIGLRPANEDIGREAVTADIDDTGRFKTPTLRNSGLKSSLMHVGWVRSVRDSIDFYNASADADNGVPNRHSQFTQDQTGIPDQNGQIVRDYDTLSMFSRSEVRKDQVADFIANALTDPRVAAEQFPFDRPTLRAEQISSATISSTLSGAWYAPALDRDGWMIEVLADDRAVVSWYSYDNQGAQMWMVGIGTLDDGTIHIDEMLVTRRIGTNPDQFILDIWGSLDFDYVDCNNATVRYQSTGERGAGSLNATRIFSLSGLECPP